MSGILTIREGLGGAVVPDTMLASDAPTVNYGGATTLPIGFMSGKIGVVQRLLLAFDVNALPPGATVANASLELHCAAAAASAEGVSVHRVTQPAWTEGGATWNTYNGSSNWAVAGGDVDAVAAASSALPTSTGAWAIPGLKALVDDAIANRGGIVRLLIKRTLETGAPAIAVVHSGEHATDTTRPTLVIGHGGAAVMRRRMEGC